MKTLVLLRHGESDVERQGPVHRLGGCGPRPRAACRRRRPAASCWPDAGLRPEVVHTSVLTRAIQTAHVALRSGRPALAAGAPVLAAERAALRRAAGQGQGGRPAQEFGDEQFMLWRRSYDVPPPPHRRRRSPVARSATRGTRPCRPRPVPRTECLEGRAGPHAAVLVRRDRARPRRPGGTVLVVAHGNSLRALVKHLDGISDAAIAGAEHPDRHPAGLRARRRPSGRPCPAAATWIRRPPPRPPRRSRTRAGSATAQRDGPLPSG